MTNSNKAKMNGKRPAPPSVRLEFHHPTATTVAIAGSFNEWRPDATPMVPLGEGRWVKDLVLPPGTYEYLFVADGNWLQDPVTRETVPNGFGGLNSVLHVPNQASNGEA